MERLLNPTVWLSYVNILYKYVVIYDTRFSQLCKTSDDWLLKKSNGSHVHI